MRGIFEQEVAEEAEWFKITKASNVNRNRPQRSIISRT
jgi:hypothetical protein